jgi:hypothetical protein
MSAANGTAILSASQAFIDPFETLNGSALQLELTRRLQPATRRAVVACHGLHREIKGLEEPLTILTWVTIWIRDWGLIESDAEKILRMMTDPEKLREHRFASDLKCNLASAASDCIKRRERERVAAENRLPEIDPDEAAKAAAIIREAKERFSV